MKKVLPFIILLVLFIPAFWKLLGPGYFNMHDDLQVMRLYQLDKCFQDGQIPCRWSPDMAWGYGQPMFNFYSATPYYFGYLLRLITPLSYMGTVLTMFWFALVVSGIGMYLLVREIWGKWAGVAAAVLFVYAPYHSLDIYIRGAMSESFALAIIPFVWHAVYLVIDKTNYKRVAYFAIALGLFLATHNISTMLFAPLTLGWALLWLIKTKYFGQIKNLALGGVLGVGLSAFFLVPLLVEKSLIQSDFLTIDYLDYNAHFVTLRQLFLDRSWGHGPSIWGPYDEISFQVGWPHWWLAVITGFSVFLLILKKKFTKILVPTFLLVLGLFTVFLTHSKSVPIWKLIPALSFVQFPWRFLGPTIFLISFASAFLVRKYVDKKVVLGTVIIVAAIVLNTAYFVPWNRSYDIRDEEKLSGIAFELQQKSAILDYLPKTAPDAPKEKAPEAPVVSVGNGMSENYKVRSNSFFFDAYVFSDEAEFEIPVTYFPGWKVISGGIELPSYPSGKYGVITVKLPEGKHIIQGRLFNTPIRSVSNALTLISGLTLLGGYVLKANGKKFLWL